MKKAFVPAANDETAILLSIRTQLLSISVICLIALVIASAMVIKSMREMKVALNRTYNSDFVPMHLIAEANHALIVLHREMLGQFVEENMTCIGECRKTIFNQKNILEDKLNRLSELSGLTGEEINLIHIIDNDLRQTLPLSEELISLLRSGQPDDARKMIYKQVTPILSEMDSKMNDFLEIQKREAFQTAEAINILYRNNFIWGSAAIVVIVLIWICLCLFVMLRSLPMRQRFLASVDRCFGQENYR